MFTKKASVAWIAVLALACTTTAPLKAGGLGELKIRDCEILITLLADQVPVSSGDSWYVWLIIAVIAAGAFAYSKWRHKALLDVDRRVAEEFSLELRPGLRIEGTLADADFKLWHWKETHGDGEHASVSEGTMAEFASNKLNIPAFAIRPESRFWDNSSLIGSAGIIEDIDFENDQRFSDRFYLEGDDERSVRRFFTSEVRRDLTEVFNESKQLYVITCRKGIVRIAPRSRLSTTKALINFVRASTKAYEVLKKHGQRQASQSPKCGGPKRKKEEGDGM